MERRLGTAAAWALALLLWARGAAVAGFEDLGAAARPLGMGNAFTALADDASALYFNPAGLAGLGRAELAASHSRLYMGLDDGSILSHSFLAYAQPLKGLGTAGVGLLDMRLSGTYSEKTYLLSFGRAAVAGLSLGGSLKVLERAYTLGSDPHLAADPLFRDHGTTSRGFSADLGALYRTGPVSLGLALTDVNEPDMGLASGDKVPRSVKLGAAYRPPDCAFDLDFVRRDRDWDALLGAERWLLRGAMAGRLGLGIGSRSDKDLAAGLSFRAGYYQVDYAFQMPLAGVSGTAGTHRLSLILRFGAPPKPEPPPQAAEAGEARPPASAALEERLRTLGDELEKTRKGGEATQELLKRLEEELSDGRRKAAAKPAAPKRAEPAAPAQRPKSYTVSEGETLQSIARKLYGDQGRWVDLYRVNQDQIGAGGKLGKGQVLVVP